MYLLTKMTFGRGGAYCFAFTNLELQCVSHDDMYHMMICKASLICTRWTISATDSETLFSPCSLCGLFLIFLQDEEGRCYSDSFAELPERDPDEDLETSKQKE